MRGDGKRYEGETGRGETAHPDGVPRTKRVERGGQFADRLWCVRRCGSSLIRKMPRDICCDPFKRHKKQILRSLEKPSQALIESVNDARINADQFLCLNCRIKLTKDPRSLPVLESSSNSSMIQDSDTSQECSESIGSSPSEAEISRQDTEIVMPVLGISPLVSASKCKYNLPT